MKRTIAIFAVALACAIAMNSACAAGENTGAPLVVAQAKPQPTEADKKKLSEEIQKRYKPGPGSGSSAPKGSGSSSSAPKAAVRMDSKPSGGQCGGTGQIAACSASCA